MIARDMTNLTPIQLEEFESVFRHFDRDGSNTLHELEFSAALASLGLVYDEAEMHQRYDEVCCMSLSESVSHGVQRQRQKDGVGFEQFIRFMVNVTEDQNTAEQVFQSFREVADGKPYVTEMDLRHSLIPDETIDGLLSSMPTHKDTRIDAGGDQAQYDYVTFMEGIIGQEAKEKTLKHPPSPMKKSVSLNGPALNSMNGHQRQESKENVHSSPPRSVPGSPIKLMSVIPR